MGGRRGSKGRGCEGRQGLTLVELLTSIAIIGMLIALLLPAVQAVRESSRRASCQNNLKQIGVGLHNYVSAYQQFPAGKKWSGPRDREDTYSIGWSAYLLNYIESEETFDKIDFSIPLTAAANLQATGAVVQVYLCPSTERVDQHRTPEGRLFGLAPEPGDGMACIDYLGISGPDKDKVNPTTGEEYGRQRGILIGTKGLPNEDTILEPPGIRPANITDGLSNTACVTECTGRGVDLKKNGTVDALNGAWASGSNVTHIKGRVNSTLPPDAWEDERIFSEHRGGAQMLMADGSVRFLSEDVSAQVIRGFCSRDGEEMGL